MMTQQHEGLLVVCSSACWKLQKHHFTHITANTFSNWLIVCFLLFFFFIIQHISSKPCFSTNSHILYVGASLNTPTRKSFQKGLCVSATPRQTRNVHKKMYLHVHCDGLLVCFHNLLTSTWNSGWNWKVGNWFKCFGEWLAVMLSMILIYGALLWVFIVEKTETTVKHIKD